MKRNLVLCGLFLFATVLTAAVDAMAQGVQFNVSATPRDVRRIGTAEAVAGVLFSAGSAGTVSLNTTIDINYGAAVTGLPALTGTCVGCTVAVPVGAPNIVRITYGADQAYVIGGSFTLIGVRVNANTYPAASIVPTLSASVPAAGNAVTFNVLPGFAVATIKDPATAVTVTAGGGILTCITSATGAFTVAVAEGFPAALTSLIDETNLGGIPAAPAAAVGTVIRIRFANVPVGVSVTLTDLVGTSGTLTIVDDTTGVAFVTPLTKTSTAAVPTLDFDARVTTTSTVAPEEVLVANFTASTAAAIALGAVSQPVTVSLLGGTAPDVPRFVTNTQGSGTAFGISDCVTNLLFPWTANVAGYDTGIAIANTTKDPYGAANGGAVEQAGSCTLTGYPAATGTPSVSFTSASVPAGAAFTMVLSSTDNPAFNGFVGYIIAVCQFQNAHAFAYITDNFGVGAPNTAQGYVALVIPNPTIVPRNPAGLGGRGESFGE